jgi:hypothetical protein
MTLKITVAMLDRLGGSKHSQLGCADVREILAQAGVAELVDLHIYETTEVNRLRQQAAELTAVADAIEARGPWPDNLTRWSSSSS